MGVTVSLNLVIVCVFAFLTLLCAAVNFGLRRQGALGWLAAGLFIASAEAYLLGISRGGVFSAVAITVMVPAAYLCVAQSVRAVTGGAALPRAGLAAVAGLTALSLGLLAAGAPFIPTTTPFQAACAIAIWLSMRQLWRAEDRSIVDLLLIAVLAVQWAIFAVRIPLYPLAFPFDASYLDIRVWPVETAMLTVSGLSALPAVFLLLARIVRTEIATHRAHSERDGLTGLLNRRGFDRASEAAARGGAVVLCDIDHFKLVNDRYGHEAGDRVIRAFAGLLEKSGHAAARLGGEEFALLLPGGRSAEARRVAELIRLGFPFAAGHEVAAGHRLSASFGVAEYGADETPQAACTRADAALYRAKEAGRDRVMVDGGREPGGEAAVA